MSIGILLMAMMKVHTATSLGAEGGVRHGLGALETGGVGGNLIGLVVIGCVFGLRASSTTMLGRVGVGTTMTVQVGLTGGKGLGGH